MPRLRKLDDLRLVPPSGAAAVVPTVGSITIDTAGAFSWPVPAGVYSVLIASWAGGGGGGHSGSATGGTGGGGGAFVLSRHAVTPGQNITGNIGAGGIGGTTGAGTAGGNTTYMTLTVTGGAAGPVSGVPINGGEATTYVNGSGQITSHRGLSPTTGTSSTGGPGGGGGGTEEGLNQAPAATRGFIPAGGTGGAGSSTLAANGGNGVIPGGGGGGSGTGTGGNGAGGRVIITW